MFLTIPTILTWTRIVAIPLIVGVFYLGLRPETQNLIATVMFVAFAATDWLDGFLARKLNQTSAFGAFLDPVADKILICASLLVLVPTAVGTAFYLLPRTSMGKRVLLEAPLAEELTPVRLFHRAWALDRAGKADEAREALQEARRKGLVESSLSPPEQAPLKDLKSKYE